MATQKRVTQWDAAEQMHQTVIDNQRGFMTYTRTGEMQVAKHIWILKTDRKDAKGNDFYVCKQGGGAITNNQGEARTWATQNGAQNWANSCGWAGHVMPIEREGIWV